MTSTVELVVHQHGHQLRGAVLIHNGRHLTVVALEPFSGFKRTLFRSLLFVGAAGPLARDDKLTRDGQHHAEQVLREMHEVGLLVERHHDALRGLYEAAVRSAALQGKHGMLEPEVGFREARAVLKRQLRAGLDPRSYQRRLKTLRTQHQVAASSESSVMLFAAAMLSRFGINLAGDLIEQVVQRLNTL